MTQPPDDAALVARIEAAKGPSGLLDIEITQAFYGRKVGVRRHTGSLDASVALIPPGLYPTLDFVARRCWLRDAKGLDPRGGLAYGCRATMPLAICAAASRARAALEPSDKGVGR